MPKRTLIQFNYALAALSILLLFRTPTLPAVNLPTGSAPAPIESPHFPSRLHTFIFRNWNLVEPTRLAKILNTTEPKILSIAASMGLQPPAPIPADFIKRIYLTVIRRNWHLLPYDQLLDLLDMTSDQLAYTLREDDFLWIKLGSLKPKCEKLSWAEPTEAESQRAAEIKSLIEKEFGEELKTPAERRFGFLDDLAAPFTSTAARNPDRMWDGLRFLYSYFAVYGDPLSDPSLDPYPDALLAKLADSGVNGVWLHVVLRQLAPSPDFPEFGQGHEKSLENLRRLVQRAKSFGVGIYLYMNEPRAMPPEFFKDRPNMAGVHEGDHTAICTSNPKVRAWLSDSLEYVFKQVPDLAGVFTITASENLTNCASHGQFKNCPQCKNRTGPDIIAEVNQAIEQGVHRGSNKARVVVWDWGWPDDWAPAIIQKLPKETWLMSVSEWSLPLERGGIKTTVGEYSISAVGPGPRPTDHWKLARDRGLKTAAKVQLNNTWELSAVPCLPVLDLIAEHCEKLSNTGVDGMMLSWSLGGYPSSNLLIAQKLLSKPKPTKDQVLDELALQKYGPTGAKDARSAWSKFSEAFREYPYDAGVIYTCPVNYGPMNLLHEKPTHYAATMIGFPYDDLTRWRGPYPPEVFAAEFEKLSAIWATGLDDLKRATTNAPADQKPAAEKDLGLAQAANLHFQSTANQARFVIERDAAASGDARQPHLDQMQKLLISESTLAKELFTLTRHDARIGFEASNHYYYVPQDLIEKVISCRWLQAQVR